MSNSLDPDQAQHFGLGPNSLKGEQHMGPYDKSRREEWVLACWNLDIYFHNFGQFSGKIFPLILFALLDWSGSLCGTVVSKETG